MEVRVLQYNTGERHVINPVSGAYLARSGDFDEILKSYGITQNKLNYLDLQAFKRLIHTLDNDDRLIKISDIHIQCVGVGLLTDKR